MDKLLTISKGSFERLLHYIEAYQREIKHQLQQENDQLPPDDIEDLELEYEEAEKFYEQVRDEAGHIWND